jgi:hypothetical protein
MDPRAVIRMNPSEAQAAAGGQARFSFAVIERHAVAYSVESAVGSWCRLLLPAGDVGRGELVVDVPDDAGPGRYALRLVATASGEEIAATNVMLRVAGERRLRGEPCLKVFPRPKFNLQPDGTVVVTLQVVNCGNVDATLVLRARHKDGWSFSIDEPELIVGVQKGPITVKVTLRPPAGHGVDHGDEITVEVNTGTGWKPRRGRVQRRLWPWVAAAAVVAVALGATAAVLASQDESDDNVAVTDDGTTVPPPADGTTVPPDSDGTTVPPPEPVQIQSLTVAAGACNITVEWDATGDGTLELTRRVIASGGTTIEGGEGEVIRDFLPVESGSVEENAADLFADDVPYEVAYDLVAYDSEHQPTGVSQSASDGGCCSPPKFACVT